MLDLFSVRAGELYLAVFCGIYLLLECKPFFCSLNARADLLEIHPISQLERCHSDRWNTGF